MGFLDQLKGMVTGQQGEAGAQGGILEHILAMVNDPQSGGLQGLIKQFTDKGLGDLMSSWIASRGHAFMNGSICFLYT